MTATLVQRPTLSVLWDFDDGSSQWCSAEIDEWITKNVAKITYEDGCSALCDLNKSKWYSDIDHNWHVFKYQWEYEHTDGSTVSVPVHNYTKTSSLKSVGHVYQVDFIK